MMIKVRAYCTRCDWSDDVSDNHRHYLDMYCPGCGGEVITTDRSLAVLQMIQNFATIYSLIADQIPELAGRMVEIHTNKLGLGGNLVVEVQ